MMKYGHFNKDCTEYIIEDPSTPVPWMNFLTNGRYAALVSQCGGGPSYSMRNHAHAVFHQSAESGYTDRPGRYIYLRDKSSKEVWSPTFQPVRSDYIQYAARHGIGYTVIASTHAHVSENVACGHAPSFNPIRPGAKNVPYVARPSEGSTVHRLGVVDKRTDPAYAKRAELFGR